MDNLIIMAVISVFIGIFKQQISNLFGSLEAYTFRRFKPGSMFQMVNPASGEWSNVMVDRYVPHIPLVGWALRKIWPCIGSRREKGVFFYHLEYTDKGVLKIGRNIPLVKWSEFMKTGWRHLPQCERKQLENSKFYGDKLKYQVSKTR